MFQLPGAKNRTIHQNDSVASGMFANSSGQFKWNCQEWDTVWRYSYLEHLFTSSRVVSVASCSWLRMGMNAGVQIKVAYHVLHCFYFSSIFLFFTALTCVNRFVMSSSFLLWFGYLAISLMSSDFLNGFVFREMILLWKLPLVCPCKEFIVLETICIPGSSALYRILSQWKIVNISWTSIPISLDRIKCLDTLNILLIRVFVHTFSSIQLASFPYFP